jgi:hypothetical protein
MDFTPGYMSEELYVQRMREILTESTKFIIMLRNPVDRMYSNYMMNIRIGIETETDSMKAFITDMNNYEIGVDLSLWTSKYSSL